MSEAFPTIRLVLGESDLQPGDFAVHLGSETLAVPKALHDFLKTCGARTAFDFISLAETFPTSFVTTFGWSMAEVKEATERLQDMLRGRIPTAAPSRTVAYGALPPEGAP